MSTNKAVLAEHGVASALSSAIDPDHPIPIYLQIASTIRGEIASGRLPVGASLPSVRALGAALGVNYHTVRHAWEELVEEGVLSVRRGRGALIIAGPSAPGPWHLTSSTSLPSKRGPVVWVAAVRWSHATQVARLLMNGWEVVAVPWPLGASMPPPGAIVLLDGAAFPPDWTARRRDLHPLATTLPFDAVTRIRQAAELLDTREVRIATSGARDSETASLLRQLPRVGLSVRADTHETPFTLSPAERVLVVADAGGVDVERAGDPRVLVLERTPAAGALVRLARLLDWQEV